ncbi:CLUMA_CG003394, isoform A [Clunio marinus]|uniref:CLUMA_CG003394, isoform A n=1 Tax=Clunio marinus TaxID=568069 RepID=A0A1J1HNY4_9DIPT|nr:CLUMA_CG003394, isoform A [Clunio marinus]
MHRGKPRMSDGYYENQSRNFQSSKYSGSNRYYRDRDPSPKRVGQRSVSPDASPKDGRDRYHQSSSYRNKDREREYKKEKYSDKRGRDREMDYKNYSKKAKTRDRSSSEDEHKDSDNRLYDKMRDRRGCEKEKRFGDWKEMISKGSGKKYYYNERDKSSQWEKPEEWAEYEMTREYSSGRGYRDKERERKSRDDRYNSGNIRRSYSSSKHSRGSSRARWPHDSYGVQPSTSSSLGHHKRNDENAEMDISPDSTPNSEPSYCSPTASNQHANSSNLNINHEDSIASSPNGHHKQSSVNSTNHQLHHQISNTSTTSISSGNRILLNAHKNATTTSSSPPTAHNYSSYLSSHHHRSNRSTSPSEINSSLLHNSSGHDASNAHPNSNSLRNSPSYGGGTNNVTNSINSVNRLEMNNSDHLIGDGPPTPEMDLNCASDHKRIDATTNMNSLQSVMCGTQISNRLNPLTPSLAKFFRADLITHVNNWPSEMLEKQAQKCAEEVYLLGDLECSRISAEIQCARSIVRVAEIAATIQSQRRLFLQEQIKSLDDSQTQSASALSY